MLIPTENAFDETELRQAVQRSLQLAKRRGMDAAEAQLSKKGGYVVTARNGAVESLEHCQQKSLVVTVYQGKRSGSASTTNLSDDAIVAMVDKACIFAAHTNEDPASGLADRCDLATHYPDLSLFHLWSLTPADAIDMAIRCEQVGREQDRRIVESEDVSVGTYHHFYAYGNSNDFIGTYLSTSHQISCGLVAKADDGEMQRDFEYAVARDPADLQDSVVVAKRAAEKTVLRLGASKIKTQRCPVIFDAPVAKSLLQSFVRAISGANLYRSSSFLLDHLHQQIFPEHINIYQRPHLPKAIGSAPFDGEGVETSDRDYVRQGVLQSYILGSYSARKLGLKTTGNAGGVYNLFINQGDHSLKELFQAMGKGLFVTELIGQGVNILTGDYSRGAVGFWIEHGDIQYPVHEVTVAGNMKTMFRNMVAVGNDVDHRGTIHTGSIWLDQMTVAGM